MVNEMKAVPLSEEDYANASLLALELSRLNNSITNGNGNLAGFLGEIAVQKICDGKIIHSYDYDFILPDGRKVDVKTKRTTVPPREYYDCSVADFNTKQKCDIYVFVRIDIDEKMAWVLGFYEKEDYYANARFLKKGTRDGDNNFVVKADCYNMKISDLKPMELL
jgi:hypothetical protein